LRINELANKPILLHKIKIMKFKFSILRYLVAILMVSAFSYSCMPRVWKKSSEYGVELGRSSLLPSDVSRNLKLFIQDTAQNAQAVVVIQNEQIILESGNTEKLINCHSARKSIMSLLIGIAKEKGLLRLEETLEELGIEETQTPLTKQEKSATIKDLLMAKSGVYIPAEAETDFAKANRPKREQYKPGEFFFYNNFDFNVLGTILEKKSGMSIGAFMEANLAKPLEMQDFAASNIIYGNPWPIRQDQSDHRVYWMYLSARDFAKIGAMVAQHGKWKEKQVVASDWIDESLKPYTDLLNKNMKPFDAYGYLWWLDNDNKTVWADGFGGQFLMIDTAKNLVLAQRNFTGNSLISSGLFMMKKKRDGFRDQVMHMYNVIVPYLTAK
jgi:CubicO group peptidase (beta-lactamase class C family)